MPQQNHLLSPFGVIGGMGPASTVRFLDLVIEKYRTGLGAILNSDFPQITIYTIPKSEHLSEVPNRELVEDLNRAFKVFECAGVAFVVAPCNTVHQFIPVSSHESNIQVLNIVSTVSASLAGIAEKTRILFLATRQTQSSGIYDRIFTRFRSEPISLTNSDQETLDEIIQQANAGGPLGHLSNRLSELINKYDSPDVILLACTELSLLFPSTESCAVVDSLESLAEATYLVSSGQRDLASYKV